MTTARKPCQGYKWNQACPRKPVEGERYCKWCRRTVIMSIRKKERPKGWPEHLVPALPTPHIPIADERI